MNQSTRYQLIIIILAAIAFFTNLGATSLWDQDEAYFAGTAAEMHARGDWITPYFNGEMFGHKPPFMFWMMMIGYEVLGVSSLAARLPSAFFGIGTALLTYHLGRRLFSAEVGLWAGLAMCSTLMFSVVARAASPDSFLLFFSTLSLYLFVTSGFAAQRNRDEAAPPTEDAPPTPLVPRHWSSFALMYSVMGLAVLVKGPMGFLLPMATIGLFLLCRTPLTDSTADPALLRWMKLVWQRFGPINFFRCLWKMRPLTSILFICLVAAPWFILVGIYTDGAFLKEFFGVHHFGRFSNAMDNHRGSIFYYIPAILVGFFPWSILMLPMCIDFVRRIRRREAWHDGYVFLACWALVIIGAFSIAATKLPSYVLLAYPALALILGCFVQRWITQPASVSRWWPRIGFGILATIGLGFLVGLPTVASLQFNGQSFLQSKGISPAVNQEMLQLAAYGWIPLVGGVVALGFAEFRRQRAAVVSWSATALLFTTSLLGFAALHVDRHQYSHRIGQQIDRMSTGDQTRVAVYGFFRPSFVHYTHRRVEGLNDEQEVLQFLADAEDAYVITLSSTYEQLAPSLPEDIVVLDRHPLFPKEGEVLVLGHRAAIARTDADALRLR